MHGDGLRSFARIGLAVVFGVGGVLFVVRNMTDVSASSAPEVRRTFFADGTVWSEASFRAGVREGETRTYYEDGRLAALDTYADGQLDGPSQAFYRGGTPKHRGAYMLGVPEGEWQRWYENGQVRSLGEFDTGLAIGDWTYWFDNGQVYMEAPYEAGRVDGPVRLFAPNGVLIGEGSMLGEKRVGAWETWHLTGVREGRLEYDQGVLHGACRFWKLDGSYDELRSGLYERGARVEPLDEVPADGPVPDGADS